MNFDYLKTIFLFKIVLFDFKNKGIYDFKQKYIFLRINSKINKTIKLSKQNEGFLTK